jgi:hypothetical protein
MHELPGLQFCTACHVFDARQVSHDTYLKVINTSFILLGDTIATWYLIAFLGSAL